jgi:hypothetical protein
LPAKAEALSLVLTIDGDHAASYSDLVAQAEFLAAETLTERFKNDPSLSRLEVVVLGDRNGQIVYLVSVNIDRDDWRSQADIRAWGQYFSMTGGLLGYSNNSRSSQSQASAVVSQRLVPEQDAFMVVEQAFQEGRISEAEYYQLIDDLD